MCFQALRQCGVIDRGVAKAGRAASLKNGSGQSGQRLPGKKRWHNLYDKHDLSTSLFLLT